MKLKHGKILSLTVSIVFLATSPNFAQGTQIANLVPKLTAANLPEDFVFTKAQNQSSLTELLQDIRKKIQNGESLIITIEGPAGVGKTFFAQLLMKSSLGLKPEQMQLLQIDDLYFISRAKTKKRFTTRHQARMAIGNVKFEIAKAINQRGKLLTVVEGPYAKNFLLLDNKYTTISIFVGANKRTLIWNMIKRSFEPAPSLGTSRLYRLYYDLRVNLRLPTPDTDNRKKFDYVFDFSHSAKLSKREILKVFETSPPEREEFFRFFEGNTNFWETIRTLETLKRDRMIYGYGITGSFSRGHFQPFKSKDIDLAIIPSASISKYLDPRLQELLANKHPSVHISPSAFGATFIYNNKAHTFDYTAVRNEDIVRTRFSNGSFHGERFIEIKDDNLSIANLWDYHKELKRLGPLSPEFLAKKLGLETNPLMRVYQSA